ncbi:unnamed protein product [Mycena citricolor]|uniref:Uncharacterized protein n=1 Tax=Mycena citricolor TaxID=2018698 RepID=A0AAD2JYK9_9AGAR|nr:unnamed protein product [Mycena citricolor]
MRFNLLPGIFSLFLALPVVASALLSINPNPDVLLSPESLPLQLPRTNAERLRLRLPLMKPGRKLQGLGSPVKQMIEEAVPPRPSSAPIPLCVSLPASLVRLPLTVRIGRQTCAISVSIGGTLRGFLAPTLNPFGEFNAIQQDRAVALLVRFPYKPGTGNVSEVDLQMLNGPAGGFKEMYLGLVVGYSDTNNTLGPGSRNYVYLSATSQAQPGGAPSLGESTINSFSMRTGIAEAVESAVWQYCPVSQDLRAFWVNDGAQTVPLKVVFKADSDAAFVLTGDLDAWRRAFGFFPEAVRAWYLSSSRAQLLSHVHRRFSAFR